MTRRRRPDGYRSIDELLRAPPHLLLFDSAQSQYGARLGFPEQWTGRQHVEAVIMEGNVAFTAMVRALRQMPGARHPPEFFTSSRTLRQFMGVEGAFLPEPSFNQFHRGISGAMQISSGTFYGLLNQPGSPFLRLVNATLRNLPEGHPMRGQQFDRDTIWGVYNTLPVQMAAAYTNIARFLPRIDALRGPDGQPLNEQQKRALAYICHNMPAIGRNMILHIEGGRFNAAAYQTGTGRVDPARREELIGLMAENPAIYGQINRRNVNEQELRTMTLLDRVVRVSGQYDGVRSMEELLHGIERLPPPTIPVPR